MMPKSASRVRRCSVLLSTLALALSSLTHVDSVRADCEPIRSGCTPEDWSCVQCDSPTSDLVGADSSGDLHAQTGRSTGVDLGAFYLELMYPNMSHAPRPPGPQRISRVGETAEQAAYNWWASREFDDDVRAVRVDIDHVRDSLGIRGESGDVQVPMPQGVQRDDLPSGYPRPPVGGNSQSDPIDPVTGELVVEHEDLSFPGFGIPFSHRRVYRSRTEYEGPLGPGWDFSYNQRLVAAPVAPDPVSPPDLDPTTGLPTADADRFVMTVDGGRHCGPVLLLTTGQASTIRFRERGRSNETITYESDAADLELTGTIAGDGTTWVLMSRSGDRRAFDEQGLLTSWTDPNGIGLTFKWEHGSEVDMRLAAVEDSVGRVIEYRYASDLLVEVVEEGSKLLATYEYDQDGGLSRAVRGDGKSERYEYDHADGRSTGDWMPEQLAANACANACALSARSCDAGGACDLPVAKATSQCLASCPACAQQCNSECGSACGNSCRSGCEGECGAWCREPEQYDVMRNTCESFFDSSGADDGCDTCVEQCRNQTDATCDFAISCVFASVDGQHEIDGCFRWTGAGDLGEDLLRVVQWVITDLAEAFICVITAGQVCPGDEAQEVIDHICVTDVGDCCAFGNNCAGDSCTDGVDCRDACRDTFLGYQVGGSCPAPVTPSSPILHPDFESCRRLAQSTPVPGTSEYTALIECAGTASNWALANGCVPRELAFCEQECGAQCAVPCEADCRGDCGAVCADKCRLHDCATYCIGLDLPGQCESSCTDACVAENRERGPFSGPKYGYTSDLQFNLIRVYDGNGNLYLENTYGDDIASPDFDTVIAQRYGEHDVAMTHVDYSAISQPSAAWATGMVDSLAAYPSPAICHYGCEASPPPRRDVAVPWQDVILVFSGEHGDVPMGGWPVTGELDGAASLPLSYINMSSDGAGTVAARSAKSQTLFGTSLYLELPSGGVTLMVDKYGSVSMLSKNEAAYAELELAGGMTLFGDGSALRAYPGSPYAIVTAASGGCTQPFVVTRSGAEEVTIVPTDACDGDLWIAPLASRARDLDALSFMERGQDAITTSHFQPSPLSPVRDATVLTLTDKSSGTMSRKRAPSGTGVDLARKLSTLLYETAPLLSAPVVGDLNEPPSDEPVYVFHQTEPGDTGGYPPSVPASDTAWIDQDTPDTVYTPPCDPTVPADPIWGTGETGAGAKPVHATAMIDMHGTRWTYYSDENGRVIRGVNHENGASRWMEYDPDGRVTGILAPDGARQCLKYDDSGNVYEVLTLPSFDLNLVTPAPIRQRFAWTPGVARLAVVMDPRDPSRELRRMHYDAAGNLRSITEIDGLRTDVALVGGTSAARAMPETITAPDGGITRIRYDLSNGTVRSVIRDETGSSPIITETESDAAGRPVSVTSPLGLVEYFEWEGPLLLAHTWDGDGLERREEYEYDEDIQLLSVFGARKRTELTYTAIGAPATVTESANDGSLPAATTCRRSGPNGRVYEEVSAEGLRTRYTYTAEGRVTSIVAGDLGPSPLPWDDACPEHASGESVVGTVATYEYDTSGRVVAMVDGRGLRTTWVYDGFGRPIIERRPDGGEVRTGYDVMGYVTWQAVYHATYGIPYRAPAWGDPGLMAATEIRYDLRNRPAQELRWHFEVPGVPIGDGYAQTTYTYDEVARTVSVTDDLGRATRVRSDGAGRPIEIRLPDGSLVTTSFLDGGRTVRSTRTGVGGPVVDVTTLTAAGAISETTAEVSGVRRVTSSTSWIDPFLPGSTRSLAGAVTTPRYDAFDRLVGSTITMPDGVGEQVDVSLDRDGRVRSRSSVASVGATAATWQFGYDALGRVVREVDPAGAAIDTDYVGATGLVWASVDSRLVRTTNWWAAGGWLEQSLVDAPTGEDVTLTFTHDPMGRMLTASRRDGATTAVTNTFAWDSLANVISERENTVGFPARSHRYDGAGQRVESTFGVHSLSRTFDALGRQTSMKVGNEGPATATWTYGAPGGPMQRQLRNGVTTSYGYDAFSRLVSVNDWHGATRVASHEWELPLDGVPRRLWSQQRDFAPENRAFAIDSAGRLAAEQLGVSASFQLTATDLPAPSTELALGSMTAGATAYVLDGRNNWLSRWNGTVSTSYSRDARDALTSIGAQSVTSDARGAITGDGTTTYRYDALGLLSEVRPVDGGGRIYKRDALGRIVGETDIASGAITRFGWDGAQRVLVQRPGGGLETTVAAEGLDQPVVTIYPNGSRRYFHQDRQGSVYAQTDDYGAGQLFISYNAYGEPSLRDGSGRALPASGVWSNFGYHGLPHDFGLGLVDMRARTYRPTLGRFLSPDPIGLLGDANLFAFVDSGPLTWRDPLGLAKLTKLRQIDTDHDRLLEFNELFRFAQCSTDSAEVGVLLDLISRKAFGNSRYNVSDAGWRWIRFSVSHGLSGEFEPRARRFAESADQLAQRQPILTTGPLGTMLTSDYAKLEGQLAFDTNMSALTGGPGGAAWQSIGYPEIGIAHNNLMIAAGGMTGAISGLTGKSYAGKSPGIAGGARGGSPFNPTGSRVNCVQSVAAFLNSAKAKELRPAGRDVAWNGGMIANAQEQIIAATGARMGERQFSELRTARAQQLFVVFRGGNRFVSDHVVVGIVTGGRAMIYDPQSGQKYTRLSDFGQFTAYPVIF